MMVNDESYKQHKIFAKLAEYINFYRRLSMSVMSFATMGTTALINIDTYVYSSIQGTVDSIRTLLEKGRINDCYSLVRKYYDSVIINTYSNLYLEEHRGIENKIVEKINNWLHGKEKLPEFRVMSQYIRNSSVLNEINALLYSDCRYKMIRDRCNDHTHYNYFQNVLLNDSDVYLKNRAQSLNELSEDISSIFILHLSYILTVCEHYMMASDYLEHLECGMTLPENSQHWVAPFVQSAFSNILNKERADIGIVILKNTSMHLKAADA
ncbi:hypothetical protein [Shewanella dokdonensis]|uniref:Uncharacterized protein n=1 Tax=Shewanella dokdonensis TaxID=712036 RepID=A0ABX8DDT7_9GAMM|nr:hypothetical protein KHX94_10475 [Shewanella dokdonensis]